MKKASDVFNSIRFAKGEPRGKPHSSTDDEEHGTVGEKEFDQQVKHVKKMAMQEEPDSSQYKKEVDTALAKSVGKIRNDKKIAQGSSQSTVSEAVKDEYDEGEYDQEGDMAKSDLRSIIANAQKLHDMIDDADNLPEWVQSKITVAEDYMSTVANYMTAEMSEAMKKPNATTRHLRDYPVSDKDVAKPVKYGTHSSQRVDPRTGKKYVPPKSPLSEGVAEGTGKNVVKSVKVGNFRHDLVNTGMGWQVRIYNGDKLHDTGMSKNSEQKGLAALEDTVAYTEKQTRTKRQGVAEAAFKDPSPMIKDSIKQDKIRSLKNLIAVAKVKGVHHKVKEYESELKKLKEMAEETEYLEEKNAPTNPELWARAKSMARSKFDVYPSAYANGWAAKWYKSKGGGWKSVSEAKENPPFDPPYKTVKKVVDKSGAVHGPMSIAKHLAKTAAKKQEKSKKTMEESRQTEIVREASHKAKQKMKTKSNEKYEAEPELGVKRSDTNTMT
jgi:hypothetical protein